MATFRCLLAHWYAHTSAVPLLSAGSIVVSGCSSLRLCLLTCLVSSFLSSPSSLCISSHLCLCILLITYSSAISSLLCLPVLLLGRLCYSACASYSACRMVSSDSASCSVLWWREPASWRRSAASHLLLSLLGLALGSRAAQARCFWQAALLLLAVLPPDSGHAHTCLACSNNCPCGSIASVAAFLFVASPCMGWDFLSSYVLPLSAILLLSLSNSVPAGSPPVLHLPHLCLPLNSLNMPHSLPSCLSYSLPQQLSAAFSSAYCLPFSFSVSSFSALHSHCVTDVAMLPSAAPPACMPHPLKRRAIARIRNTPSGDSA